MGCDAECVRVGRPQKGAWQIQKKTLPAKKNACRPYPEDIPSNEWIRQFISSTTGSPLKAERTEVKQRWNLAKNRGRCPIQHRIFRISAYIRGRRNAFVNGVFPELQSTPKVPSRIPEGAHRTPPVQRHSLCKPHTSPGRLQTCPRLHAPLWHSKCKS